MASYHFVSITAIRLQKHHLGFRRHDLQTERNDLLLRGDHACDLLRLSELQPSDPLEALLEVGLDTGWILRLREDLKELIVR